MATANQIRKPFLKWAGAKTKLVRSIKSLLPVTGSRFVEPFVGAGAVFLNSDYKANLLCDSNADLISLYRTLKENGEEFIARCQSLFTNGNNTAERFYELRAEFNATDNPTRRGALFVYLNRHCYNGLCRYNRKGHFNTPFGRYIRPYFPAKEMAEFAGKLQGVDLSTQDFRDTFGMLKPGDVVYCDPPYIPLSATANFTDYASGGFSQEDQENLAGCCVEAARRGATVVISNHDSTIARNLYETASRVIQVTVSRTISCDGGNRGKVDEILAVFSPAEGRRVAPASMESSLTPVEPLGKLGAENHGPGRMRTLSNTMRGWLLENYYEDVAALIEDVIHRWEKAGVRTRRNWWDVLAGDKRGNANTIAGVQLPVLKAARIRKGLEATPDSLCRNQAEQIPPFKVTRRWSTKGKHERKNRRAKERV